MKHRCAKTIAVGPGARRWALLLGATLAACGGVAEKPPGTGAFDRRSISSDGVNANLSLQSESAAGYCARVTLENTGALAAAGWTLVVELNRSTLRELSGASTTQTGTRLTVRPLAGTEAIAPGATVSFTFCGATPSGSTTLGLVSLSVTTGGGPAQRALTIRTTGNGTTSPAAGITSHAGGSKVQVVATPADGHAFTGWSGDATGTARTVTLTMDADKELTATFAPGAPTNYTLTIAHGGNGSGTTSPAPGTTTHDAGTSVSVTATANSGATFAGWSGDATGTASPVTVLMDRDRTVTATFAPGGQTRYTLTIAHGGNGSGTTSPAPGTTTHDAGTSVSVTATANSGATFAGWSGDATGTASPATVRMDRDRTVTATFSAAVSSTFSNSVLWQDLADIDIIRVDDTYYYMASNMHYSPGAPILRSYDLVNWEYAGHAVPVLDFGPAFDLNGGQAYIKGTWASFLNYRKSNKTFYFGGLIQGVGDLIYTATSVEGPWVKHQIRGASGYYDGGLLIDDDDTMYVAHNAGNIRVAQLSADGFSQVKDQEVYNSGGEYIEGSRFYKRDGNYYILVTKPASWEYVLRSTTGPFGPYTKRPLVENVRAPVAGAGAPHQGGIVETQKGDWYYMAFVDAYPGGRIPVLAPVEWVDGWPVVQLVDRGWGASYPYPDVPPPPRAVKPLTGVVRFEEAALDPRWEWNHNPDNSKWSAGSGLKLQTATVTNDLYRARNTLTHRILGPSSTATIELDYSAMKDGDRAGLAILRHTTAWVGVRRDGGVTRVAMVSGLAMDGSWNTTSTGTEVTSAAVTGGKIWLRAAADIRPGTGRQVRFSYSTDGATFTPIGNGFTMDNAWQFFMGYRFAMFNYATQTLGGAVTVKSFDLSTP